MAWLLTKTRAGPGSCSDAWIPLRYPNAIYDENTGQWTSDSEITGTTCTAFTSCRKADRVIVRLIVNHLTRAARVPPAGAR